MLTNGSAYWIDKTRDRMAVATQISNDAKRVLNVPTGIPIVILGAGPAGLGAAYRLARRGGFDVTVIERNGATGGNAGSFDLEGFRVDFGSHRLHPASDPEILADIRGMLGEELLTRPRHGRIRLGGRWLRFPLRPLDLVFNVPPAFAVGVGMDALPFRSRRNGADTFAQVLENKLGPTICREFYFPYAEKIWGLKPDQLSAEQAKRRVSAGSLGKMVRKAMAMIPGFRTATTGIFYYPRAGFGAISDAYANASKDAGAKLLLNSSVTGIAADGKGWRVNVATSRGSRSIAASQVLSTIPVTALAGVVKQPAAPPEVLSAAKSLKYRAMLLIYLVLEQDQFTEYDAHYFPGTDVLITRLSEPKNYSLLGPKGSTVLCAELPCSQQDAVWSATPAALGALAIAALETAGLPVKSRLRHVEVRKLPQAYPIYTRDYACNLHVLDEWASGLEGIVSFGRQGLFAHDNTHHALAMAYALDESIGSDGALDGAQWAAHRQRFEKHVVED